MTTTENLKETINNVFERSGKSILVVSGQGVPKELLSFDHNTHTKHHTEIIERIIYRFNVFNEEIRFITHSDTAVQRINIGILIDYALKKGKTPEEIQEEISWNVEHYKINYENVLAIEVDEQLNITVLDVNEWGIEVPSMDAVINKNNSDVDYLIYG